MGDVYMIKIFIISYKIFIKYWTELFNEVVRKYNDV